MSYRTTTTSFLKDRNKDDKDVYNIASNTVQTAITATSLKERIKSLESAGFTDTFVKKRVPTYATPPPSTPPLKSSFQSNIVYEDNNYNNNTTKFQNVNLTHHVVQQQQQQQTHDDDDDLKPHSLLLNQIRQRAVQKSPETVEASSLSTNNIKERAVSPLDFDADDFDNDDNNLNGQESERDGPSPNFDGSQFVSANMDAKFYNDLEIYDQPSTDQFDTNQFELHPKRTSTEQIVHHNHDNHQHHHTEDEHFYENDNVTTTTTKSGRTHSPERSRVHYEDESNFDSSNFSMTRAKQTDNRNLINKPNTNLIFNSDYSRSMNQNYHVDHFACWHCDQSLSGSRYILRDEHPYCIRCYEELFSHVCEECKKRIGTDSKDLSYKDKHWHERCFFCSVCKSALIDKPFGSKNDDLFCGECYNQKFASRCDKCAQVFKPGMKKMEYRGQQFHESCFNCSTCSNPIGSRSFIPRDGKIHCIGCYEDQYAVKCTRCARVISQGGVTYKNQPFHRECFSCSNCHESLAGLRFTSRDDHPYCSDCFGKLFAKKCFACTKPITATSILKDEDGIGGTKYISFEDRHWHNDCFICNRCHQSLVGRGFITENADILCPECGRF